MAHYVEHLTADETGNLAGRFRAQVLDVLRNPGPGLVTLIAVSRNRLRERAWRTFPMHSDPRHQARPLPLWGRGCGLLDRW
ncbi:hypothetical protein [Streptosporangium canum]|uniref:hypothetical protein n=1 Tax=Streptosporangium canum TaxID=324952 RepID=UPI0037B2B161